MKKTVQEGSETAKNGFKNEQFVIELFNDWKNNELAQYWLETMGYKLSEIEYVKAVKVTGSYKADIQVQVTIEIKLKEEIDCQNISIKLVSNPQGFNQIDKRWVDKYIELWNIPNDVKRLLKHYTGEEPPYKSDVQDNRRMFILKGRGQFLAEWMLVIYKHDDTIESVIKPMNEVLNYYSKGDIEITKQGNIKIGRIGIQRKGGDGGRPTANMLQFKMNPMDLFIF